MKGKESIINLTKTYNECFKWSILSVSEKQENVNDAQSYRLWKNELNFDGINSPVEIEQIEKFMEQNKGIAVNVYQFDEDKKRKYALFASFETS